MWLNGPPASLQAPRWITNRFDEATGAAFLPKRIAERQVQLRSKCEYWPDKTHLAWHGQNKIAAQHMGLEM
jgi:hypothetical protein